MHLKKRIPHCWIRTALVLSALLYTCINLHAAELYTAPDVIDSTEPGRVEPMWVSEKVIVRGDELNWDYFPEMGRSIWEQKLEYLRELAEKDPTSSTECIGFMELIVERTADDPPFETLEDLVIHSKAIYLGTVVDSQQGFSGWYPGTLLAIDVHSDLKNKNSVLAAPIHVFYPFSKIQVGEAMVCRKQLRDHVPAVGSRILIFSYEASSNGRDQFIMPREEQILFEKEDGSVSFARDPGHPIGEVSIPSIARAVEVMVENASGEGR